METRALAIAFFYAVGTAVGGITGPLLFGHLIDSGSLGQVAFGFYLGAAVMAIGGIAELLFGVRAEQRSLEDIATPLTAQEAEGDGPRRAAAGRHGARDASATAPAPGRRAPRPACGRACRRTPCRSTARSRRSCGALRENGPTDRSHARRGSSARAAGARAASAARS